MTGTDEGGFGALLAAARAGDAVAWSQLYHDVAPILIGYLRAQRLPDPDDVAGEVLLEVVRDLHRFAGDERSFRSWVLAIAHHRLLDARRRAARRPSTAWSAPDLERQRARDDTEAECLATLALGELAAAIDTLTPDQRSVLLLRVVGDLPIADVAAIVGKRPGAVKQLQRRAVEALRGEVRDAGERVDIHRVRRTDTTVTERDTSAALGAHRSAGTVTG